MPKIRNWKRQYLDKKGAKWKYKPDSHLTGFIKIYPQGNKWITYGEITMNNYESIGPLWVHSNTHKTKEQAIENARKQMKKRK